MQILDLLNKTQEFSSTKNAVSQQKGNLDDLEITISDTEKNLKIMKKNRDDFNSNITTLETQVEIIDSQVEILYEACLEELLELKDYKDSDPDFLEKAKKENAFIKKLNTVEKALGKELTEQREIKITTEIQEDKQESTKSTADSL